MRAAGHNWTRVADLVIDNSSCDSGDDDDALGSKSTWYRSRNTALARYSAEHYQAGAPPFVLVSRAKHSAYKQCVDCQDNERGKIDAIAANETFAMINSWTVKQQVHVAWILGQRFALEAWRQQSLRDLVVMFEQSDKCGDSCLFCPGGGRVSGNNSGKYQLHIALQAHLFPGKCLYLNLLLPSLRTGANFGATSFLHGLYGQVSRGHLTPRTETIFRGSDGGSELVAFTCHGVHATVAKRLRKDLLWARLPPEHSHEAVDRYFSWVEGHVNGAPGGCSTPWELEALIRKFHRTSAYKEWNLQLGWQLCNRNIDKWLEGRLNRSTIKNIKVPLVWLYQYCAKDDRVRALPCPPPPHPVPPTLCTLHSRCAYFSSIALKTKAASIAQSGARGGTSGLTRTRLMAKSYALR